MKILFVTSEHPARLCSELGAFTREYVKELRRFCEVVCVYLHFSPGKPPEPDETVDYVFSPAKCFEAFSLESRILETAASFRAQVEPVIRKFRPDVIHCNDRQTFMPFRFEKNVLYSSHLILTDLIKPDRLDDAYFQETKVERCAMILSAVCVVYSPFALRRALCVSGGKSSPVVLPLGINTGEFRNGERNHRRITVSYFGRFEDTQKGVNDFITAVNILGRKFKKTYTVEYNLFGYGVLEKKKIELFNPPEFLTSKELSGAYLRSDIVVMPSRYESFGFTGLEAMASGCLLLVTEGLGMDMYAKPGVNSLSIPHNAEGLAAVLRDAVINFSSYQKIIRRGISDARKWTWERCVRAHMFVYRQIAEGRTLLLKDAYREELYGITKQYASAAQKEKSETVNEEAFLVQKQSVELLAEKEKTLLVTGSYGGVTGVPAQTEIISAFTENSEGVLPRLECLPYRDRQFSSVVVAGGWETVFNPESSLHELMRISRKSVTIWYYTGSPRRWQTNRAESVKDWRMLNKKGWKCSEIPDDENRIKYRGVRFLRVS